MPLPWGGTHPPFGFSPDGVAPWMPQPEDWAAYAVETEERDPGSMLSLYRAALRLRRGLNGDESFAWLDSGPDAICFRRGEGFVSVTNFSSTPLALPEHDEVLLSSTGLVNDRLAPDSTAWLRTQH